MPNLNSNVAGLAPGLLAATHPQVWGVIIAPGVGGVLGTYFVSDNFGADSSSGFLGGRDPQFQQLVGVYGESSDQGVLGHATTDIGTGVFGNSKGGGFGVRGETVTGVAVQGQSLGSGFAGKFLGSVEILGTFTHNGSSTHNGNLTHNGNINLPTGGNINLTNGDILLSNADCAEDFDITCVEQVDPGTVMVIDSGGALQPSSKAYDKRVAGVISGAGNYKPGLILDKQESSNNRMPVALMGKVYCKVDAQYGAIEVGDLLTTSPTPGYAMKAADSLKAFGAVIGKALCRLETGQELIPVLIALQ